MIEKWTEYVLLARELSFLRLLNYIFSAYIYVYVFTSWQESLKLLGTNKAERLHESTWWRKLYLLSGRVDTAGCWDSGLVLAERRELGVDRRLRVGLRPRSRPAKHNTHVRHATRWAHVQLRMHYSLQCMVQIKYWKKTVGVTIWPTTQ